MISIKSNSVTERTLLVSAYKPPEIKFQVQDWIDLFNVFNYLGNFDSIIVAGDLNVQFSG